MNEDSELLYQEFIKSFDKLKDDNLCTNNLASSLFEDEDPNDPEYNFHQDITSLDLSEFLSFCEHLYENDNSSEILNQEQDKNETESNEIVAKESCEVFTNDQLLILYNQICFHIQTLAQNWIISIKHTNSLTNGFKEMIFNLYQLSLEKNKNFLSYIRNLQPAYSLIMERETQIINDEKNHNFECALSTKSKKLFLTRKDIFIFDWALPQIQFKSGNLKTIFTPGNDFLIAFGLYDYFRLNFKKTGFIKHIQQNFLPTHSYHCLANHLKNLKRSLNDKKLNVNSVKYKELLSNPIVYYYREKKLPPFNRYFTVQNLPNIDKLEPPPQWYQKMNKEEHPLCIDEKKESTPKTETPVRKSPSLIKPNMEIHQLNTFVFNNIVSMYQLPVKFSLINKYINSNLGINGHLNEIKQYTKLLRNAKRLNKKKIKESKQAIDLKTINEQKKSIQLESNSISNEDIYSVQCSSSSLKINNSPESQYSEACNDKNEIVNIDKEIIEKKNFTEFEKIDEEENCIGIENNDFNGENENEEIEIDAENDLIQINKKAISEDNEDYIENDDNNENYNENVNNENQNLIDVENDNDNNDGNENLIDDENDNDNNNDNENLMDDEIDNDNNNDNEILMDDENDLMALMEASWTTVSNRSKDADSTTRRKSDILVLQRNSCKYILKNDFSREEEKSKRNEMLINYYLKKSRKLLHDEDYVNFLELISSHLNKSADQTQMTIDQAKSFYFSIKEFLIKIQIKYNAKEEMNGQNVIEGINELIQLLVLFLDIFQAKACGQTFQYMHWKRIFDFFRKVELYLSFIYSKQNQQHSCIQKLVRCLNQLMPENQENKQKIKSTVSKILNNHPLLIKEFSLLFLEEPLAPYLYSNDEDFDEFMIDDSEQDDNANFEMENAFIPLNESDLKFGTNDCPCIHCHEQNMYTSSNSQESNSNTNHCALCSIRFISGRIYLPQMNNKKLQLVEYVNEDKIQLKSVDLNNDSKDSINQNWKKQWTFHEDRLLLQACRSIILDSNIKKLTKQVIERVASILVPKFEKRNIDEISERLFYLIEMMAHV